MLDFKVLNKIRKDAKDNIKTDSDGERISSFLFKVIFVFAFYLIPLGLVVVAYCKNVMLSDLEGYVGASIAIFTGLFFSLILSIGGKVKAERDNPDKDQDNFQRFKENMKQIANITLYTIMHGIVIFVLMLLNSIFKNEEYIIVEKLFTAGVVFLLVRYTVSLFFMLQRFAFVIRDEIQNIL